LNAEVERRIEVVGIFSNGPAITRVVDALLRATARCCGAETAT
jgi:transposase-like protein